MEVSFFNRDLETMPRERLRQYQWEKLRSALEAVWASNQFYRAKWSNAGIRDIKDIKSLDDFVGLPFTKKHELVADQEANPPYGTNLTYGPEHYVRFFQTSGTTGRPLKWLDTGESWDWWADCWAAVFRAAGIGRGDKVFFPFSFGPFVGFWSAFEAARKIGALAMPGGGMDTPSRLHFIMENKPDCVCCTPSYALRLAEVAAEQGISLRDAGVRATIHAGEPGASIPATRAKIEEAWGARCFDHNGMTEVGAMGFSCAHSPCNVHLNEGEFFIEILNPETLEPVGAGESGEMVVTNLGRVGMPVFRYRTGDRVKPLADTCACGRTFVRMEGGIIGRVDDMLIVRGVNVFPSSIEAIIRTYPEVSEFFVEVYRRTGMDELNIKLEIDQNRFSPEEVEALVKRIGAHLKSQLQIRVDLEPVPAGALPRFEMKAKRFVRVEKAG